MAELDSPTTPTERWVVETSSSPSRTPLIGITGPDNGGWTSWWLTAHAIRKAGGKAVRIRPSQPVGIENLDGLIVGGGADVNPQRYKEEAVLPQIRRQMRREMRRKWRKQQLTIGFIVNFFVTVAVWLVRRALSSPIHPNPRDEAGRDALEFDLVQRAIEKQIPILGICRGMQLLNVALGGSLHQEITRFYEETPHLTTVLPKKKIEIEPNSRLHKIFGHTMLKVNSLHFQSVKTLGEGLRVTALEPNGIVQGIEHEGPIFRMGVQWHPEYLPTVKIHQNIFRELVAHCTAEIGKSETVPLLRCSDDSRRNG